MEALAAAGYQVTVICPRARGQRWREIINGVCICRFPTLAAGTHATSYFIEFFWATFVMTTLTLWIWMRHGMDVLHVYNPPETLFVAGLLPKLAGKTILYDLRDITPELYRSKYEHNSPILYNLLIRMEYVMCQLADHIIVVNESYRRVIVERDRAAPERVSIVRQAPDLNQVRMTDPDPNLCSRANTIIAYLGRMARQDGIEHLLVALHYLEQRFGHKDWLCTLVGPVEDQPALEALAAELGIADRIWFTGFYMPIEQWLPILSSADICVEPCPANPLNNISTMNKIMDYMALRKPTVAYDLCEHRFTAGEAALYAEPNNQVDLARQIARLIEDVALRIQLGDIGRQRMEQMFAWQYQKDSLLTVYAKLAQEHSSIKLGLAS
jgi:glycosyltransferase involved in cell wall biosynthesis